MNRLFARDIYTAASVNIEGFCVSQILSTVVYVYLYIYIHIVSYYIFIILTNIFYLIGFNIEISLYVNYMHATYFLYRN